jgi:ferredoxin
MAGDVATAHRVARDFCYQTGACLTVTPSKFIYTGETKWLVVEPTGAA